MSPSQVGEKKGPVPISAELQKKRSIIPIIYPDHVAELDPRTGKERIIPDQDLIVDNGKVWGRYIRLGREIKFTMSYHNYLCVPTLTADIETVGESSRPVRSFSVPGKPVEKKYDDCKEDDMKKAAGRIQESQTDYRDFNQEVLRVAPPDIITPED